MSSSKIDKFFNLLLSTRRVFHITTDYEVDEKDSFKDKYFSSYGSGILIKVGIKYFLLTAKHVLKDYLDKELPNTSPFRVTCHSTKNFNNTNDFLYPKRIWNIGSIIHEIDDYEVKDVVLVELFQPLPWQGLDHFIELETEKVLDLSSYSIGLPVFDSGFSEVSNPYFYEGKNSTLPFDETRFTSSTVLKRDVILGKLNIEKGLYFFEKMTYLNTNTNGMSGGLIITIEGGKPQILGLHIRGGEKSNRIIFIPFCKIKDAILSYQKAPNIAVDYLYYERMNKKENLTSIAEFFYGHLLSLGYDMNIYLEENEKEFTKLFAEYISQNEEFFMAISLERDELDQENSHHLILKEMLGGAKKFLLEMKKEEG
ncbi:TPA: hypothetical protein RG423_003134 [Acinetobacter baumannii]|uniref:hypothetical protein n=1 Tax=Acinetobacter baumannii TaxID=470 RepID=UPI0025A20415|nr:hypothetical protein [Acinetobacter baumannii]MDV7483680.1 hypothetical protein [Acinetobacter baumannii]HDU8507226.1 hypothetical protein [Acinetobacter baumannii]